MWPGRAALLLACCLPASTALSLQQSHQDLDRIPKTIWVTGQWKSDSAEVKGRLAKNFGRLRLEKSANQVQAQLEERYAKWAPIGSRIRYFTDEDMDDAVRNISTMLAGRGIKDVDKAYFNLRPGAFRADVWRLMQLWAEGGVYLDVNLNLTCSLNRWIHFSNDELVVVTDTGANNGIWNAMMAARPRNQYIESAIAGITKRVLAHYYGSDLLAITGPSALGYLFRRHQGYPQGLRDELRFHGGRVSDGTVVVARKDETLHDQDASKHYAPMWGHHQVYCDQMGPDPDHGKCPEGSWRNEDGSVKYQGGTDVPLPRSNQDPDNIPKYIWVTGQWTPDSAEVQGHMAKNTGDQPLQKRAHKVHSQIEEYYAKWAPVGSYIRYFTDEDMDGAVRNISTMLAMRSIKDVDKAYFNLRPGAFRSDLWRLMQLWAEGGVYLDANINLTCSLNEWIDFSNDELVVVTDTSVKDGVWNAMMAAGRRNQYLESAIADITRRILAHYYGSDPLAITGPSALGVLFRKHLFYPQGIREEFQWKWGQVSNRTVVVARKDNDLHVQDASKHYDPMWRNHQVFCDQKGPDPDHGKCPEGSWRDDDGTVKYDGITDPGHRRRRVVTGSRPHQYRR